MNEIVRQTFTAIMLMVGVMGMVAALCYFAILAYESWKGEGR